MQRSGRAQGRQRRQSGDGIGAKMHPGDSDTRQSEAQNALYPPPRLVFWETTAGCNLACAHCRRLDIARELMQSDLTTSEGRRLINQIAAVGRPVLVLSGGEPLMRPDIFDLADHAKTQGLLLALATNGTLIDRPMAARIAAVGFDRVSISLDGADAATHDGLRGQVGSFERAVTALGHLRQAGVPTQVNCTIARHNQHQLADVLALGERAGVVAVHYFLLVPVGCGEQIAADQMLDAREVEERLLDLYELEQRTDLQIKATCAPHYYRIVRQQAKARGIPRSRRREGQHAHPERAEGGSLHTITKGCLAGTGVCFISHEGKVFPCGYLPVEAGDVRAQDFGHIWRTSRVFADLRDPDRLTGRCGACEFRMVCGGCRARAFYETGSYLDEEPYCVYEPIGWNGSAAE